MLTYRKIDISISIVLLSTTSLYIASSPCNFVGLIAIDVSIRFITFLLYKNSYISKLDKEIIDYISGGILFASSYNYCRQNLFSLLDSSFYEKILVTGFIPMLAINFDNYITNYFTNNEFERNGYCLIGALKFTSYQGIKALLMPTPMVVSNNLEVSEVWNIIQYKCKSISAAFCAYLSTGILDIYVPLNANTKRIYLDVVKDYFTDYQTYSRCFTSAFNASFSAMLATAAYLSEYSNSFTYDLVYSTSKILMDKKIIFTINQSPESNQKIESASR